MPFLAARALRRRTAWNLVQIQQVFLLLMTYTKLMPFLILLLTCCSFLVALTWDMIWGAELFREWVFWLYGHWEDSCNQPIGPLQQWFWIVLWLKIFVLASWAKWNEEGSSRRMRTFFCYVLSPLAMMFDLGWPIVTFICLWHTSDCSKILQQSCWLLLMPYLLQVLVALFSVAWDLKRGLDENDRNDPAKLAREFHLQFIPGDRPLGLPDLPGCEGSCSICLAEISNDQSIVVLPCANGHIFHSSCLAGWLEIAQSCPLCRQGLKRRISGR